MNDLANILQGLALLLVSWLVHVWSQAFPILTGLTALFAFILAAHGVTRLVWRWVHGINTLNEFDSE